MRTRPPRKWNLPLTYRPKIARVASGEIRQTIRPGWRYQPGDLVSFHGWEGRPYRSRWTDRTPYYKLQTVFDIEVRPEGMFYRAAHFSEPGSGGVVHGARRHLNRWGDRIMGILAEFDGIDPPSGEELGRILMQMHDIPPEGKPFQIIRW